MTTEFRAPGKIRTRPPFSTLFPINSCVWEAIKENMEATGFDASKPLDVWRQENILLDGHTRLAAAKSARVDVAVFYHDFDTEEAALEYAISNQRNRRNLTDADIVRCVTALDKRNTRGGDKKSEEIKAQSCALILGDASEKTATRTAELVGVSSRKVEQVRTVLDHAPAEVLAAVEQGDMSINKAYIETQQARKDEANAKAEDLQMSAPTRAGSLIQLLPPIATRGLHVPSAGDLAAIRAESRATFNQQKTDNIEWARWSWNPVTGCLHNCDYCYARDIAARFYEQGFAPTFLPERLAAPRNTKVPARAKTEIGYRNCFVCSMADLWGKWVSKEVIDLVMAEVIAAPQWNFLFLTKFPARYPEFQFPANAWIGTSVDRQQAVHRAEKAFAEVKARGHEGIRWLSCEPMLEPLQFTSLEMFDWVVIGGSSRSTQTPEFQPPLEWIIDLYQQARAAGCKVYFKTNLLGDINRIREYPGQME